MFWLQKLFQHSLHQIRMANPQKVEIVYHLIASDVLLNVVPCFTPIWVSIGVIQQVHHTKFDPSSGP